MPDLLPLHVERMSFCIAHTQLLKNLSFTIDSANITAIMGHNGAGKSLLLRLLHGLLQPGHGTIHWGDFPAASLQARRRQALVFQKPVLLRRSVADNIDYVLKLRADTANQSRDQLLARAGLLQQSQQMARSLSGGEQQRLALIRALALSPSVLMLDEPTASLDPVSTVSIETLITEAKQSGIAVILVTHDIAQARRLADQVLFLDSGQLAEQTTAADFFQNPRSSAGQAYLKGIIDHSTKPSFH